jgi:RimJ/RimL family protein N-acetyltransferase
MSIELIPLTAGNPVGPTEFLAAVLESRPSLQRWMPWCHANYSLQDAERWFEQADAMWRQCTAYPMLIVGENRRLIGGAGLQDLQLFGKREADIGYWVRASDRGRGVAATAMRTVAAFAFNELRLLRCGIRIQLENRSSRRAAERAGARFEGVVRNGLVVESVGLDAALYSLLPTDLARDWAA